MTKLVDEAMEEGAGGFSSGLEYFPGILAAPEHLVPMCEVAAKYNRLYATHVRNRENIEKRGGDGASVRRQASDFAYPAEIRRAGLRDGTHT